MLPLQSDGRYRSQRYLPHAFCEFPSSFPLLGIACARQSAFSMTYSVLGTRIFLHCGKMKCTLQHRIAID